MPEDNANRTLVVRLTEQDWQRIASLQDWLRGRYSDKVRITQKTVILEALDALEKRRNELERPR